MKRPRIKSQSSAICGRMLLQVQSASGETVSTRRASNIVLRQGAAIVATLFAGAAGTQPITHIQVGFGRETVDAETTSLTTTPAAPLPNPPSQEALRSPIAQSDFTVVTDKPKTVQVLITSIFTPTVELVDVSEAGLMAADKLYNQVVFEPITLQTGQDITFFWEIDFPFGH